MRANRSILILATLAAAAIAAGPRRSGAEAPTLDSAEKTFLRAHDLAPLMKPKTKFLGYLDPGFRRLKIAFHSVRKDPSDPTLYHVEGRSLVGRNACAFAGTVRATAVKTLDGMHYGLDDEHKEKGIRAEGFMTGAYEFKETSRPKACGVFRGKMQVDWYVDKNGRIQYDDIEASVADGYKNNQYEGTWTPYGDAKAKPRRANWGEHRIPASDGLDIGASEFGPDPKHRSAGWEDFPE